MRGKNCGRWMRKRAARAEAAAEGDQSPSGRVGESDEIGGAGREALNRETRRGHSRFDHARKRIIRLFFRLTQENGVSEVSANRGCVLTKRASARNPSEEANISDFEILYALRFAIRFSNKLKTSQASSGLMYLGLVSMTDTGHDRLRCQHRCRRILRPGLAPPVPFRRPKQERVAPDKIRLLPDRHEAAIGQ